MFVVNQRLLQLNVSEIFSQAYFEKYKTSGNLDPPIPSRRHQIRNLTLIRGLTGVCPCLLDAYPPIQSVSWYRNGVSIRIEPKGTFSKENKNVHLNKYSTNRWYIHD